jgi:hypothetical protein
MIHFTLFRENNDWEGEDWSFWLQRDGNEAALRALSIAIDALDDAERSYKLELSEALTEAEVDLLCRYAGEGYYASHNKVTGRLVLPEPLVISGEDDVLYKGGIRDLFLFEG